MAETCKESTFSILQVVSRKNLSTVNALVIKLFVNSFEKQQMIR